VIRINCKILSLTYKVLITTHPSYLHNLISVQRHCSIYSSNVATLSLLFLFEGQQPLFPSRITLSLESASQETSPACWSWRLITFIWSHTHQFVISFITTVTIHYSCPPLQAKTSSFPQIIFSIVLPFNPLEWLHRLSCFSFFFSDVSVLTLALCARLSWILVSF